MTVQPWQTPVTGQSAVAVDRIRAGLPRIARDRIILRAPYLEDFPLYEEIACGQRGKYIGGPMSQTEAWEDFLQLIASWLLRGCGMWTVEEQTTGKTVGFVSLNHEAGDPEIELGFFCTEEAEGRGLAYEAAVAARNNAFFALNLETLVSYIDPENTRAIRLAERLGGAHDPSGDHDGTVCYRYPRPEYEA
jgi:RimJ/RimL family protein N-acetyltransferase